jgi:hypothetical protein
MTASIVRTERAERIRSEEWATYGETGQLLTMSDGSIWFHPYNGRPPRCEKTADNRERVA